MNRRTGEYLHFSLIPVFALLDTAVPMNLYARVFLLLFHMVSVCCGAMRSKSAAALSEDNNRLDETTNNRLSGSHDRNARPQDMIFAFGPGHSYFISPQLDRWRYFGMRPLADHLNTLNIVKPIALSLAPEGGAVFVYENETGGQSIGISEPARPTKGEIPESWTENHEQYRALYNFLGADPNGELRKKVSLSIGSGGSWFARRGTEIGYHALPKRLEEEVRAKELEGVQPWQISLGVGGDYVVLWSDDSKPSWSLSAHNEASTYLESHEQDRMNTVVLSPYRGDSFFLVRESGWVAHSIADTMAREMQYIKAENKAFIQREAKRRGRTYGYHGRHGK